MSEPTIEEVIEALKADPASGLFTAVRHLLRRVAALEAVVLRQQVDAYAEGMTGQQVNEGLARMKEAIVGQSKEPKA